DERQRPRSLAEISARDLARLDRLAGAVEDVVDDLERDAEVRAERTQGFAAAEQARRLEQLRRLQRAAFQVSLDRRVGIVLLALLHRFASGETERGVGKDLDGVQFARRGELAEGACEEVVAGCTSDALAVRRPD